MNPWWPLIGEAVRPPLPYPWRPAQPPPVDQDTLRRIIVGLERLGRECRTNTRQA